MVWDLMSRVERTVCGAAPSPGAMRGFCFEDFFGLAKDVPLNDIMIKRGKTLEAWPGFPFMILGHKGLKTSYRQNNGALGCLRIDYYRVSKGKVWTF